MGHGRMMLNRRRLIAPLSLVAAVIVSAVVAAVIGWPVWAAALGAALCLGYWALEQAAWRRASRRQGLALGTAIGGMLGRLALVLAVLVLVGVVARPAFGAAALSFLASFTLYAVVRLFSYPLADQPSEGAQA
jgi:hypothetical protein